VQTLPNKTAKKLSTDGLANRLTKISVLTYIHTFPGNTGFS